MTQRRPSARTLLVSSVLAALLTAVAYLWLNPYQPAAIPPTITLPPPLATAGPTNSPLPPSAVPSPTSSPLPSPTFTATATETPPACGPASVNQPDGQAVAVRDFVTHVFHVYDNSLEPPRHHFIAARGEAIVRADAVRGVLAYECAIPELAPDAALQAAQAHQAAFPADYVFGPSGEPLHSSSGLPPVATPMGAAGVWFGDASYSNEYPYRALLRLTYDPAEWEAGVNFLGHKTIVGCSLVSTGGHGLPDEPPPIHYRYTPLGLPGYATIFENSNNPECDAAATLLRESLYTVPNPAWEFVPTATPLPTSTPTHTATPTITPTPTATPTLVLSGCSATPFNSLDGQILQVRGEPWYLFHVFDNGLELPLHHFIAAQGSATVRADDVRGVLAYECADQAAARAGALQAAQAHHAAFAFHYVYGPDGEFLAPPNTSPPDPALPAQDGAWYDIPANAPEGTPRVLLRMTYDPAVWAARPLELDPLRSDLSHQSLENCFLRTESGRGIPATPSPFVYLHTELGLPNYSLVFVNASESSCDGAARKVRESVYTVPNPAWTPTPLP